MNHQSGGYGGGAGGGMGGGGYGGGQPGPGGPPGPKRMEGIGNPMFKDPRMDSGEGKSLRNMTLTDVMSVAKDGVSAAKDGFAGIIKDPLARKAMGHPSGPRPGSMNTGGYGGGYGGGGGYGAPSQSSSWSAPPGQAQLASATNGQWTMASNRGPNAISSSDSYGNTYKAGSNNISSGIGGSWGSGGGGGSSVAAQASMPNHNPVNHNPVVNISGPPGAANTSGTYEKNLIMELCPPGGMKPEPPADKLASFCQSLSNLNSDLVCPALLDMLEDGQPWIIRAKVLCVMERCVEVGEEMSKTTGNNVYADFFHMCSEEIKPLANHSRSAVREPAKRVLKVLGIDHAPAKATAAAPAVAPKAPVAAAPAPNLLDFGDDEPPTQGVPQPPTVPPPPPPSVPTEAPPVPPPSSGGDLFGGMTIKTGGNAIEVEAPVATMPIAPTPAPVPVPIAAEPDLFGTVDNVVVQPAPTPVAAPSNASIFDNMNVKPNDTANVNVAPAPMKENVENANTVQTQSPPETAAPSSSGFSFMNSGATDTSSTPAGPGPGLSEPKQDESMSAHAHQPPKPSFDPLLSMGMGAPSSTNTANVNVGHPNSMAMNAQMAALMQQQQQQIMMMQAQMQQMRMGATGTGPGGAPGVGGGQFMGENAGGGMQAPRMGVMGGMGGSGVATSFAFMEDPNKVKREASNKKFDFVQDAMKGAR